MPAEQIIKEKDVRISVDQDKYSNINPAS